MTTNTPPPQPPGSPGATAIPGISWEAPRTLLDTREKSPSSAKVTIILLPAQVSRLSAQVSLLPAQVSLLITSLETRLPSLAG